MATVTEKDVPPKKQTVGDMFGNVWEETVEVAKSTSTTLHGRAGRPLWPVALCVALGVALVINAEWATVFGIVALLLLTVWLVSQVKS
jgi:hypothetical protein